MQQNLSDDDKYMHFILNDDDQYMHFILNDDDQYMHFVLNIIINNSIIKLKNEIIKLEREIIKLTTKISLLSSDKNEIKELLDSNNNETKKLEEYIVYLNLIKKINLKSLLEPFSKFLKKEKLTKKTLETDLELHLAHNAFKYINQYKKPYEIEKIKKILFNTGKIIGRVLQKCKNTPKINFLSVFQKIEDELIYKNIISDIVSKHLSSLKFTLDSLIKYLESVTLNSNTEIIEASLNNDTIKEKISFLQSKDIDKILYPALKSPDKKFITIFLNSDIVKNTIDSLRYGLEIGDLKDILCFAFKNSDVEVIEALLSSDIMKQQIVCLKSDDIENILQFTIERQNALNSNKIDSFKLIDILCFIVTKLIPEVIEALLSSDTIKKQITYLGLCSIENILCLAINNNTIGSFKIERILCIAIKKSHVEIIKTLLNNNIIIYSLKSYDITDILCFAIKESNVEVIKVLLNSNNIINSLTSNDITDILCFAIEKPKVEFIEVLLNSDNNNLKNKIDSLTSNEIKKILHSAVQNRKVEVIKVLLSNNNIKKQINSLTENEIKKILNTVITENEIKKILNTVITENENSNSLKDILKEIAKNNGDSNLDQEIKETNENELNLYNQEGEQYIFECSYDTHIFQNIIKDLLLCLDDTQEILYIINENSKKNLLKDTLLKKQNQETEEISENKPDLQDQDAQVATQHISEDQLDSQDQDIQVATQVTLEDILGATSVLNNQIIQGELEDKQNTDDTESQATTIR